MSRGELEAALRRDLDDEQVWTVYGDLLAMEGDLHGELIALQQRAAACERPRQRTDLEHRAHELFEREHRAWLGPLADAGLELQWIRGFITRAEIARQHSRVLGLLLELPAAALLSRLALLNPRSINKIAAQLASTPLEALEIRSPRDNTLAPLAALTQLNELCIDAGSTEQLAALAQLPTLQHLELTRFDGGLEAFATGFAHLTRLTLSARANAEQLGPDALAPLARLSHLRELDLHDGGWFALEPIAGLRELRRLDLRSTDIGNLDALAGLEDLRELELGGCTQIADLAPLTDLRALEQLNLSYTRVRSLLPLAGLDRLETLHLSGTAVGDLRPLFELPALRRVNIEACEVQDVEPLLARGVTVVGVRPPEPDWRELAQSLLRQSE